MLHASMPILENDELNLKTFPTKKALCILPYPYTSLSIPTANSSKKSYLKGNGQRPRQECSTKLHHHQNSGEPNCDQI